VVDHKGPISTHSRPQATLAQRPQEMSRRSRGVFGRRGHEPASATTRLPGGPRSSSLPATGTSLIEEIDYGRRSATKARSTWLARS
jgi:hypothetical protein